MWIALLAALPSCAAVGLFTDGTSVSLGSYNHGRLRHGARLPQKGEGYLCPPLWQERKNNYATDELIKALRHAAARVRREYPGALLGIGDLSSRGGGRSIFHHSHENGRDADLIYYAVDEHGRAVAPVSAMPRYLIAEGQAKAPSPSQHGASFSDFSPRWFDLRRNWALVRALLEEPSIEIQYLFIHNRLRDRLLAYAQSQGESADLIDRARELMRQPRDSLPHDDHLHVRIFCAPGDRALGCVDRGPLWWLKKHYKYMLPRSAERALDEVVDRLTAVIAALPCARVWL